MQQKQVQLLSTRHSSISKNFQVDIYVNLYTLKGYLTTIDMFLFSPCCYLVLDKKQLIKYSATNYFVYFRILTTITRNVSGGSAVTYRIVLYSTKHTVTHVIKTLNLQGGWGDISNRQYMKCARFSEIISMLFTFFLKNKTQEYFSYFRVSQNVKIEF